ncbi:MAG: hypothetical protein CR982_08700 [Candidatus Cloacimonadota bacterium]|nr:MAG: hypothetical protein CR982_08700 [Candidatus Cloacimonadota bacterium]PIE78712.1 MAG: hypothetical protein CSA15_06625 [Candidatus Delongbacteria bacterium]
MKKKKIEEETIIIPDFNFDGWIRKFPTIGEKLEMRTLEEAKDYLREFKDDFPFKGNLDDIDIENLTEEDKREIVRRLS